MYLPCLTAPPSRPALPSPLASVRPVLPACCYTPLKRDNRVRIPEANADIVAEGERRQEHSSRQCKGKFNSRLDVISKCETKEATPGRKPDLNLRNYFKTRPPWTQVPRLWSHAHCRACHGRPSSTSVMVARPASITICSSM